MSDPVAAFDQAEAAFLESLSPDWQDAYRRNPDRVLELVSEDLSDQLEEQAERLHRFREWFDNRVLELRRNIDDAR